MAHADFVHLRVHSAYSLLEGAIPVKKLASLCRDHKMPAVAITDTNNLFGALEFSMEAANNGIQPIIGCQLSLAPETTKEPNGNGGRPDPLAEPSGAILLVQNEEGYRNLLKLISKAYLEGEATDDPQVTLGDLEAHSAGLLLLTGGPDGPLGRLLQDGQLPAAEALLERLAAAFPNRLYVELMRHGMESEMKTDAAFIDLAYQMELPLVATNEAFFPSRDMYEAHDALICIAEGAYVSQTERRRLTPQHHFKTAEEMRALFADVPEAIDNTLVIAKRTAFMVEKVAPILPPFDCGEGRTEEDELRAQSREGLEERLQIHVFTEDMTEEDRNHAARPYRERLEYELDVIVDMGFPGYFLIVAEFIHWAKEHSIPVGPGRGSGAGSVVAWALTITDLDPLRWGLLFERFLNPERVSMPDFDIDFCQDLRDQVIQHVQSKYGRDHVAQIITFGKLQARAVLRDVGRVLEMPYPQVDRICKLVPNNPANPVTLAEAIKTEPQLDAMIRDDETVSRLVNFALKLEGLYRHASTHAAGVVIGDRPLEQLIPLYRDPRSDMPVTGFNMKYVESAGLVKFDFLGLKTLTVLHKAVGLIGERGIEIGLSNIPLDDQHTYEMLGRADTVGVFQLESAGMRDVLRKLKADSFEDIIAVVALYRPGPMDNIPSYIRRKHGEEEPDYLYPTLESILKETSGIMIYQEQVMQIAQELSGYTLGSADLLRRAMGKKIQAEMDQQRQIFVDGAKAKGVKESKASQIFDQVAKFAGYGFNKSHAAAYALVAYQTAYLKANYPVEFLAASMTLDMNNTDKLNVFRQDLDRLGIDLLPPDLNASGVDFRVESNGASQGKIRYALAAIKNVGEGAMETLVKERSENGPFESLEDFTQRLDTKVVNKRQMENLVRAGAFDGLNPNRRQVFEGIETLLRHASAAANERDSGQMGLFGGAAAPDTTINLPDIPDWAPMDRLKEEFDAIGFYLSAHPLDDYGKTLKRLKASSISEVLANGVSGPVVMAGTVIAITERTSQKGNRYAFVQCSDTTGVFEVTVFSEGLSAYREFLEVGSSLFIKAAAEFEGDSARFTAQSMEPLDAVAARSSPGMKVTLDGRDTDSVRQAMERLMGVLDRQGRGRGQVDIVIADVDGSDVLVSSDLSFAVSPSIISEIRTLAGVADVEET